ncbi:MAG: hypothetical protein GQ574_27465 [Crocinitomix sp.]|nr:hypothetical protein [Crocinitomix sp.]
MDSYNTDFKQIQDKSRKANEIILKGIDWIKQNTKSSAAISKQIMLENDLRTINRVLEASKKRPSIAIFGQSQVGKSFLVRSLAKSPKTAKLEVLDPSSTNRIDFLQKINPPGGRESTGIITRFSTAIPKAINTDYNFKLELISQLDLAAIIVNAYLGNIREFINDFDRDEVVKLMLELKSNSSYQGKEISKSEVVDFNNYVQGNYRDNFIIKEAKSINFFNDLAIILPSIPSSDRWIALSFLWGRNEFLTNLFKDLSETLNLLNFSKTVYTNSASIINDPNLVAKEFSDSSNILDVARVKEIYQHTQLPKVAICDANGKIVEIARGKICALIKELHLTIPDDFDGAEFTSFLNYTDLLDFPGSKNQETTPEQIFNNNPPAERLSAFVRGKVSYLFYLYNRDLGISTLLYCMHQDPPEVSDSPFFLEEYVKQYAGENPQKRKKQEQDVLALLKSYNVNLNVENVSPLIVAMTKFNIELTGKGDAEIIGETKGHNAKWFARFQENFCTYMQKPIEDKWIDNWTAESDSFKFIFPLRDPGFSTSTFEGYKLSGLETEIRQEEIPLIEDMKKSFLTSEIIDKFIFNKNELWDNLLTPNKTGIDYLCKYLAPSSHPANMIAQLNTILSKAINSCLIVLEGEYQSGNMDEDLRKAKMKGANAFMALLKLSNSQNRVLTDYFSEMVLKESEVWSTLYGFKINHQISADDLEEIGQQDVVELSDLKVILESIGLDLEMPLKIDEIKRDLKEFYGVNETDLNAILKDQLGIDLATFLNSQNERKTPAHEFTQIVIDYWVNKLSLVVVNVKTKWDISEANKQAINSIIDELMNDKLLTRVNNIILKLVEESFARGISEDQFNALSGCITSVLNRFVFSASWLFENEEFRPRINKTNKPIFHALNHINDRQEITADVLSQSSKSYMSNFSIGVKELYASNVKKTYEVDDSFNVAENQKIGLLITDLNNVSIHE